MKITKLNMSKGNRMIRFGFGQYDTSWFLRIDLWWIGFRITKGA